MSETRKDVRKLVIAISNLDKIYTANTPRIGRQSNELWLMYALNDGEPHSQKQICEEWGFPRTTLNTVTKKCEADGYLELTPIPGKRREMLICLTYRHERKYTFKLSFVHKHLWNRNQKDSSRAG